MMNVNLSSQPPSRAIQWQDLFIGLFAVWHGIGYVIFAMNNAVPPSFALLPSRGIVIYAVVWMIVGLLSIIAAVWVFWSLPKYGIAVLCIMWASAFIYGYFSGQAPLGWFGGGFYITIAGIVVADPVRDWWMRWLANRK